MENPDFIPRSSSSIKSLVLLALGFIGLCALSAPAKADLWQINDGFESSPASLWGFWASEVGAGGFDINKGNARTGANNAWIYSLQAWSDVGRSVSITPYRLGRKLTCAARIYVQGSNIKGQLEVIDSASWYYVSVKPFTVNSAGYVAITTDTWEPARKDIYVRVGLISNGGFMSARVDDMTVQCQYY